MTKPPSKPKKQYQSAAVRTDLKERRVAEQARRDQDAAEWDARSSEAEKLRSEWRRRWTLSLAIANSAGVLGTATILLDVEKRPHGWECLLLPSGWLFVVGVLAAGAIPLIKSFSYKEEKDWAWIVAREREDGGPTTIFMGSDEPEPSDFWRKRHIGRQKRLNKAIDWTEGTAGACFVLGLISPLLQMSLGLCR